jgi:calcineurin-like phosphoesterase family protein
MTIWLTADTHFGHSNIIKYCGRPFTDKVDHDQTLIECWNDVVQKNDHIYHLGDFGFGGPGFLMDKVAGKLKGTIHLIKGNHDGPATREPLSKRFEFIKDVHFLKTQLHGKKIEIFLSHYSHRSWPKWNYGVYHAFGHSHNNLPPYGNSMDVGVDAAFALLGQYRPFSLDEFVAFIEKFKDEKKALVTEEVLKNIPEEDSTE